MTSECPHSSDSKTDLSFCPICLLTEASEILTTAQEWKLDEAYDVYEISEELGRGGAGVVYRARHRELGREVALKVLHHGPFTDPTSLHAFRREIETAARLDHPHLLKVYDLHLAENVLGLSMPLCKKGTLKKLLSQNPPLSQIITLVKQLCGALAHAHDRGQLHLDVKASNVLLADDDSALLADFGVGAALAIGGEVGGTPGYAAPEQFQKEKEVTILADVYGLGSLLTETLKTTRDGTRITDLEAIAAKARASQPEARYSSTRELEADLQRWQEKRPVIARPLSQVGNTHYWIKRNPALTSTLFILFTAIAIATFLLWQSSQDLRSAQKLTEQALQEQTLSRIESEFRNGESTVAAHLLSRYLEQHPDDDAALKTLGSFLDHRRHFTLESSARDSSDFQSPPPPTLPWLKEASSHRFTCAIAIDPAHKQVAIGDRQGWITLHRFDNGRQIAPPFHHLPLVKALSFNADGSLLFSGAEDHRVRVWRIKTQTQEAEPIHLGAGVIDLTVETRQDYEFVTARTQDGFITRLALAPASGLSTITADSLVSHQNRKWTTIETPPRDRPLPPGPLRQYFTWENQQHIAVGTRQIFASNEHAQIIWKYRSSARITQVFATASRLWLAQLDGLAVALDRDGNAREIIQHGNPLFAALPSPDGLSLLTASYAHDLSLWRIADRRRLAGPLTTPGLLEGIGWTHKNQAAAKLKTGTWLTLSQQTPDPTTALKVIQERTRMILKPEGLMLHR